MSWSCSWSQAVSDKLWSNYCYHHCDIFQNSMFRSFVYRLYEIEETIDWIMITNIFFCPEMASPAVNNDAWIGTKSISISDEELFVKDLQCIVLFWTDYIMVVICCTEVDSLHSS